MSKGRSLNKWDMKRSIAQGRIDHQVDGSVTPDCVCVCDRKPQYRTALVADRTCNLIEKEREVKGRGREERFQGGKQWR